MLNNSIMEDSQSRIKLKPFSFLNPEKRIWFSKPKFPQEIKRLKSLKISSYLQTSDQKEANLSECGVTFFKTLAELCEKRKIFLTIPETVIIGYGFSSPCLLYTNEKGYLSLLHDLNNTHIKSLIELFEKYRKDSFYMYAGPLAIKREPNSDYNRIIMKKNELILQWKNAYKVDLVLQRYILSKGTKISKIRISLGSELKIFKIVNKIRKDLKKNFESSLITTQAEEKKAMIKKSIFTDFIEDNVKSYLTKSESKFFPLNKTLDIKKSNDFLPLPKITNELLTNFQKRGSIMPRKSFMISDIEPKKKTIMNLKDYFQNLIPENIDKSYKNIKTELFACNRKNSEFTPDEEDIVLINGLREKLNNIFTISIKDLGKVDVYEIKSVKSLEPAIEMIKELKRVVNGYLLAPQQKTVGKIVCDFITDFGKKTFLLKVVSFESSFRTAPLRKNVLSTSYCPGEYCKDKLDTGEQGIKEEKYFLLKKNVMKKSESDIFNSNLYGNAKVCRTCLDYMSSYQNLTNKGNDSCFNLKKFTKVQAKSIIDEINPRTAEETVKILPDISKVPSFIYSSFYKKDKVILNEPAENLSKYEMNKDFYINKISEILDATYEEEFFSN